MDKLKIMVVDDESRMRKLVKDFLKKKDFEVIEAADGEEALDIFFKDKSISLIICDVKMPKINGCCERDSSVLTGADYYADGKR